MSRHVIHLSYLASPILWLHDMNSCIVHAPLSNLVTLIIFSLTSFGNRDFSFGISDFSHKILGKVKPRVNEYLYKNKCEVESDYRISI